jgi:hypothetical protein
MNFETKSAKRMTETGSITFTFSRPFYGLCFTALLIPAVNCWATFISPLCGLIDY